MNESGRACCIVRGPQPPVALRILVPHKEPGSWKSDSRGRREHCPLFPSHPPFLVRTQLPVRCSLPEGWESVICSYLFPCSLGAFFSWWAASEVPALAVPSARDVFPTHPWTTSLPPPGSSSNITYLRLTPTTLSQLHPSSHWHYSRYHVPCLLFYSFQ